MLDSLTTPMDLEGVVLGPVEIHMSSETIARYVDATGDDSARWRESAPPGYASVLLFSIAELFLRHRNVTPFTATLLHMDQSFAYHAPMRAGSTISMEGTVTRVRQRGDSYFVSFEAAGSDRDGPVVETSSTFVLSDRPAPPPETEHAEPSVHDRGSPADGQRSASRHDLVRYAAATRDFNPLHWDHAVAVAAGLPGVVVHGLLMYAWMVQAVVASESEAAVRHVKVRFRSALHPAQPVTVTVEPGGDTLSLSLERDGVSLVTGRATVAGAEE